MQQRFMSIWFRHLTTDWQTIRRPELKTIPFVFVAPDRNRIVVVAANPIAEHQGIHQGMPAADAKAFVQDLEVIDEQPNRVNKLLKGLGEWCIRYSPIVAVDLPDGLILDISGCDHLWGGEREYLKEIVNRLRSKGYDTRAAIADTIGCAWAIARFGKITPIIASGEQGKALLSLPPAALRIDTIVITNLRKLGFRNINSFNGISRSQLRRRFGADFLLRLGQALGEENEPITPIKVISPYEQRLPCLEPIRTKHGIEIAIQNLLESLCKRLKSEGKGMRKAILTCYRIDGKVVSIEIGTNTSTHHIQHLFKLFELKISNIEPKLGIELFVIEATKVEDADQVQEALWSAKPGLQDTAVAELLDRVAGKVGILAIRRFLPAEHFWPERSIKRVTSLTETTSTAWRKDMPRPVRLLDRPELIEVSAPIPDYPPMLFIYKGKRHDIKKADGPERIEREWWLDEGKHRDYYIVEDQDGQRYWLFRSGHYAEKHLWYLHGFFA
jgi:protein ImuB